MSPDKRAVIATTARLVGATLVAASVIASVAAAAMIPLPRVSNELNPQVISPALSEQVRVCPGSLMKFSRAAAQDTTQVSHIASPTTVYDSTRSSTELSVTSMNSADSASPSSAAPRRISAPGSPNLLISASQTQRVADSELSGLAAATCSEASAGSWLVAGSTTTGRSSLVFLTNPTEVPATVNLAVWGESGSIAAPGATGILVPARSQRIVSLAGYAPNLSSPVVQVTSVGGAVLASLQSSVIRGLEPGGVELTGAIAEPATKNVITGVEIAGTNAIAERLAQKDNSDLQPILRIAVPGSRAASLSVTFHSETVGVKDNVVNLGALAGGVTDVPLRDLVDGTYSITIDSDEPVLVAARSAVVLGGIDFAWYQATPSVTGTVLFSVAPGPNPRLHLMNNQKSDLTVTVKPVSGGGVPEVISVPANTAVGAAVQPNMTYTLETTGAVSASVGYLGEGVLSRFIIDAPSPLAAPITIYPGE